MNYTLNNKNYEVIITRKNKAADCPQVLGQPCKVDVSYVRENFLS